MLAFVTLEEESYRPWGDTCPWVIQEEMPGQQPALPGSEIYLVSSRVFSYHGPPT